MSGPIYTDDDLDLVGTHHSESDLEWCWDDETPNTYTAHLRLEEGDTGPLDVEGPCLATYRQFRRHYNCKLGPAVGDISVTTHAL